MFARGFEGVAPPTELEIAFMCGDSHLPDVGGVLDQDYDLITRMRYLKMVYYTVQNAPKYIGKQIHNMPKEMGRMVVRLNKMHLWNPAMQIEPEKKAKEVKGIGDG